MKRLLLSLSIILLSINTFCQSSVRGFKSLEKGEYDKAIETFTKHISDDSTSFAAHFGLALTYAADKNPKPDFFAAWDHYAKAKNYLDKITPDESEFFKQFFFTRDASRRSKPLTYNFEFEEKAIEERLIKFVREENSLEVAEHFLKVYPNSRYYENVMHIRNQLKYRLAEKANTLEAYNEFIKQYPDAAQIPKVTRQRNALAFAAAKKENSIAAYTKFVKEYPDADQYYEALKNRDQLSFEDAKKKNSIEAIENFIKTCPKALQIMNARTILRKLLYEKAKQVNTLEAYNDFISKYPEGEYFVDIFNLKANILGQNYGAAFEGARNAVVWIKGFDFDEKNDIAGGIVVTPDGKTIIAGNRQKIDAEGTQCWMVAVDNTGKVLWNKAFGSKPYNQATLMNFSTDGHLLIAGWSGASPDTLARKAWIFKVEQNGNGQWEKTIDGNEVKDMIITTEGDLYFSGYQMDDSARMKAFLLKLNPDAKKLWSRQYIKRGSLDGIAMNAKNELVCAAGSWIWRVDKQGYILWEKIINKADSIIIPRYANGQLMLCGTQNNIPLIVKMNEQGNPAGELYWTANEPNKVINCLALPNKHYLTLETPGNKVRLRVIDDKGTELKSLTLPSAQVAGPGSVIVNAAGEVFMTFTSFILNPNDGDICVMKLVF
jgi:tetratricopeptide (TPR) repeat protein